MMDLTKSFKSRKLENNRGVAQLGSALGSGPRGREFKSPLPDQISILVQRVSRGSQIPPE